MIAIPFWMVMAVALKVEASTDSEKDRVSVSLDRSRLKSSSSGDMKSPVKFVTCRAISDLFTTGFPTISAIAADVYVR